MKERDREQRKWKIETHTHTLTNQKSEKNTKTTTTQQQRREAENGENNKGNEHRRDAQSHRFINQTVTTAPPPQATDTHTRRARESNSSRTSTRQ